MIWVLVFVLTLLLAATILLMLGQAEVHKRRLAQDHAKCVGAVAAFVGDQFAAQVLDAAAEHWETSEGKADVKRVIATQWTEQGPEIPSLWLRDRAAVLRGEDPR